MNLRGASAQAAPRRGILIVAVLEPEFSQTFLRRGVLNQTLE
jgi:hypothetical protein